jgi:flagellar hook-length control protein FliK
VLSAEENTTGTAGNEKVRSQMPLPLRGTLTARETSDEGGTAQSFELPTDAPRVPRAAATRGDGDGVARRLAEPLMPVAGFGERVKGEQKTQDRVAPPQSARGSQENVRPVGVPVEEPHTVVVHRHMDPEQDQTVEKTGNESASAHAPEKPVPKHSSPAGNSDGSSTTTSIRPLSVAPGLLEALKDVETPAAGKPAAFRIPLLPQELSSAVIDQVIRGMELNINGKSAEFHIRLEPESLGEVGLRVRVDEGRMQAQIDVSQPAVKAALESHLPQLRQVLASQGIDVDRIDVFTQGDFSRDTPDGNEWKSRRRGAREADEHENGSESARQLGYNTIELIM